MNARAWIAIVALFACASAAAAGFDVASLMQKLAATGDVDASFTETKYSAYLARPLASAGTLAYRRPDTVEKVTTSPRRERFRIVGEVLELERAGRSQRVALASQPVLLGLAAGLRGVLSGDEALLRRHFEVSLAGEERAWQLVLKPRDESVVAFVESLSMSGRGGGVDQVEIREAGGDRSVMHIQVR